MRDEPASISEFVQSVTREMLADEHWVLAACSRNKYLALALVRNHTVQEIKLHRVSGSHRKQRMLSLLRDTALEYAIDQVVVESRNTLSSLARESWIRWSALSLAAVKDRLLGRKPLRHESLFHYLLARDPRLKRLVSFSPITHALGETWSPQNVEMLAVALALAVRGPFDDEPPRANLEHFTN